MAPRGNPPGPGYSWCDNCGKWKADEAFVRSSVKRGSKQWKLKGFNWKRYRTCNRCSRVYFRKGMSLADFIKYWGAEEHNKYVSALGLPFRAFHDTITTLIPSPALHPGCKTRRAHLQPLTGFIHSCKPNDDQKGKRDGDDEEGGDGGGMGGGATVTAA